MSEKSIRIAIADDHKIFREGIKIALERNHRIKILWEACDGMELIDKIRMTQPTVLLMDISMPGINGVDAIKTIRAEFEDVKIIVLTMYDDEQMIRKVMELGANGYLIKTTEPDEIFNAVVTCFSDNFYLTERVGKIVLSLNKEKEARAFAKPLPEANFNEKEIKILQLLSEDKGTDEISKTIYLSPRTIESIRQNMKLKVNAKTIGGLIMYGLRHNLIH